MRSLCGILFETLCLSVVTGSLLWPHVDNAQVDYQDVINLDVVTNALNSHERAERSDFPNRLIFNFVRDGQSVSIGLSKSHGKDINIPVYVQRGQRVTKEDLPAFEGIALYQNVTLGASVAVSNRNAGHRRSFQLSGKFTINGRDYLIHPHDDESSENGANRHVITQQPEPLDLFRGLMLPLKSQQERSEHFRKSNRKKRDVSGFWTDLLAVVDYAIYKRWYSVCSGTAKEKDARAKNMIRQYYSLMINAIDRHVLSQAELANVALSGIFIADSPYASWWSETNNWSSDMMDAVWSTTATEDFTQWLLSHTDLPPYDHAVLFTGYDLISSQHGVNPDYNPSKAVCPIFSCSIVEDHWDVNKVKAATRDTKCSLPKESILDYSDFEIILKFMTLELRDPDSQCQTAVDDKSVVCRSYYHGQFSSLCRGLWCSKPGQLECVMIMPTDGMSCGNNKWCFGRECRYSTEAPTSKDNCPFGDAPGSVIKSMTCSQIVKLDIHLCKNNYIQQMCCKSCDMDLINRNNCDNGDLISSCMQDDCLQYTEIVRLACCHTCRHITRTTAEPVTSSLLCLNNDTECQLKTSSPSPTGRTTSWQSSKKTTFSINITPTVSTIVSVPQTSTKISTSEIPNGTTLKESEITTAKTNSIVTATTDTTKDPGTTAGNLQTSAIETSSDTTSSVTQSSSEVTMSSSVSSNQPGVNDAQTNNSNDAAMTIGIGTAAAVVVLAIVTIAVVYFVRAKMMSRGSGSISDDVSRGSDFSDVMSGTLRRARRWYPEYGSNTAQQ